MTSTVTNRLLIEQVCHRSTALGLYPGAGRDQSIVSITELIDTPLTTFRFHSSRNRSTANPLATTSRTTFGARLMSYVTVSQSLKCGYHAAFQVQKQFTIGNPN